MSRLEVVSAGTLTTVQDRGRVGWAHLGVPRAGALDAPAAALANRLVGNPPDAAVLETVLGGLALRNAGPGRWAALTGASTAPTFWWAAGGELRVPVPTYGLRSYVAVAGGIDVDPVLGSRSTDTLAWVGPPRVVDGTSLPLGEPTGAPRPLDVPPARREGALRVLPGPRADWFASLAPLFGSEWVVRPDSDRIGLRLDGPALERVGAGELPSEGMVLGAVQVPPSGRPIVFLADHPPTGGYPVVGVVHPDDLWRCAQVRPGERVRFRGVSTR
ncbi:biotin-dependent carboxyltransferase family protein [Nocardioides sp. CER19]|uniref:5-oxoprolinase subunit C family protein n=1 Tax=Nocardioides sp. CER19 TaxID=3038538 RepID=UPI002449ADA6|nr:biotin-dependent carboxyltransferase family protein [Nocardioides sp. CER19]MDH2416617.1 biotin-dependent carboxyltransferase family protein [Nocardioides sp. CER19]